MARKDVDFTIELKVREAEGRLLGGEEAEIVDRAIVSALVQIVQKGKGDKPVVSDHIGDYVVSREKVHKSPEKYGLK